MTISKADKKIINGTADVNQLLPLQHQWAWDKYKAEKANHWDAQEISMTKDIEQWKTPGLINDEERRVVENNLSFFVTADSLAANNIVLGTYRLITSPEARLFLLRQAFTEAVHTESYSYITESLGLDVLKIFNAYTQIPCIRKKDEFLIPFINRLCDPSFKTGTLEKDREFFESLFVFACIMEGLFFYVGFAQILALGRRNILPGTAEQYKYILRDESNHCNFGIDMMNQIKHEQPEIWTDSFKDRLASLMNEGAHLEEAYAIETMPNGFLGLNSREYTKYVAFIANRRLKQLGIDELFDVTENPFPWLSEVMDLSKEVNFFEKRPIEYQSGGALSWD